MRRATPAAEEKRQELEAFRTANSGVLDEYSSMVCAEQQEIEDFIRNHFAVFVQYNDLRLQLSKLYQQSNP